MSNADAPKLDSADYPAGPFAAHGRITASKDGNVFHSVVRGPFNLEGIAAYGRAREAFFSELKISGPCGAVLVFEGSLLMPPDAIAAYEHGEREGYRKLAFAPRFVAVAWVVGPEVEGGAVMSPRFEKFFAGIGIPFRIFERVGEAEAWVAEQMRHVAAGGT